MQPQPSTGLVPPEATDNARQSYQKKAQIVEIRGKDSFVRVSLPGLQSNFNRLVPFDPRAYYQLISHSIPQRYINVKANDHIRVFFHNVTYAQRESYTLAHPVNQNFHDFWFDPGEISRTLIQPEPITRDSTCYFDFSGSSIQGLCFNDWGIPYIKLYFSPEKKSGMMNAGEIVNNMQQQLRGIQLMILSLSQSGQLGSNLAHGSIQPLLTYTGLTPEQHEQANSYTVGTDGFQYHDVLAFYDILTSIEITFNDNGSGKLGFKLHPQGGKGIGGKTLDAPYDRAKRGSVYTHYNQGHATGTIPYLVTMDILVTTPYNTDLGFTSRDGYRIAKIIGLDTTVDTSLVYTNQYPYFYSRLRKFGGDNEFTIQTPEYPTEPPDGKALFTDYTFFPSKTHTYSPATISTSSHYLQRVPHVSGDVNDMYIPSVWFNDLPSSSIRRLAIPMNPHTVREVQILTSTLSNVWNSNGVKTNVLHSIIMEQSQNELLREKYNELVSNQSFTLQDTLGSLQSIQLQIVDADTKEGITFLEDYTLKLAIFFEK